MTCTTHHICDCMKERIHKLEEAVKSARKYAEAGIKYRLSKMTEAELAGFYNYLFASLEALEDLK